MYIIGFALIILGLYLASTDVRTDRFLYKIIKTLNVPQNNLAGILLTCGTISLIIGSFIS